MSTKLTITIDPAVIGQAKQYARSRGRSLSNLIEDYLRALTHQALPSAEPRGIEPVSKARRLQGILAPYDQGLDYQEILAEELVKKHR